MHTYHPRGKPFGESDVIVSATHSVAGFSWTSPCISVYVLHVALKGVWSDPKPAPVFVRYWRTRSAFTLIELLVAIAIVMILLGLSIPAIQRVRSTLDLVRCQSNLRQIGAGLLAYHADRQKYPPGGIEWRPPGNTTKRQLAWSAFLLPYIEKNDVFARLDLNTPFDSPQNAAGAAAIVPVYLCPASHRVGSTIQGRGAIDYGGIFGERITGPNNPPKGAMIYDQAFRMTDISDGLSTTLIISEDNGWVDGQWINGLNIFDQAYAINQAPPFENDIRSDHQRGANGLFCDGSVRFLHQSMGLKPLAAICTRAGKETVDASAFE